jgi:hypothetical protein
VKVTPVQEIRVPFGELLAYVEAVKGLENIALAEVAYFDRHAEEVVFHVRVREAGGE